MPYINEKLIEENVRKDGWIRSPFSALEGYAISNGQADFCNKIQLHDFQDAAVDLIADILHMLKAIELLYGDDEDVASVETSLQRAVMHFEAEVIEFREGK